MYNDIYVQASHVQGTQHPSLAWLKVILVITSAQGQGQAQRKVKVVWCQSDLKIKAYDFYTIGTV